jgi:probable addiction module antidote protein
MNVSEFKEFDVTKHLDSEEAISEYFAACLELEDNDLLMAALSDIAKARGMSKVARDAGLNRESLYKALSPGSKPGFDTVRRVMAAVGVKLTAVSAGPGAS